MNTPLMSKIDNKYKVERPVLHIGDTVVVDTVIRETNKKRIQKFKGMIIAMKGKGITKTFTVRKISYGIGVEKILPLYSPNVAKIEVLKHGKVRRAKLYYLRDRVGKAASYLKKREMKEDVSIPVENEVEASEIQQVEETSTETTNE